MTPEDLISDLRTRIVPMYARRIGTESWERKRCADALEALVRERDRLRQFAEKWTGDGSLQTFQDRERFRAEWEQIKRWKPGSET